MLQVQVNGSYDDITRLRSGNYERNALSDEFKNLIIDLFLENKDMKPAKIWKIFQQRYWEQYGDHDEYLTENKVK